jgi:hypothetical protein
VLDRIQLAMPAENRVRTKHGGNLEESFAADSLAPDRESTPLIVGESRAFAVVQLEENSVLLDQELDDVSLLSVEPARGRRDNHLQRRKDSVHGRHRRRARGSLRR